MGEVLDAAEAGHLDEISDHAFHALLAIAERCRADTRQGSVSQSRIRAAIRTRNSTRTFERAMRELKAAGLVQVVRRGHKPANSDTAVAPVYELAELPPLLGGGSSGGSFRQNGGELPPKRGVASATHPPATSGSATINGVNNGVNNGVGGERAPQGDGVDVPGAPPPRKCRQHQHHADPPDCGRCKGQRQRAEAWRYENPQAFETWAQAHPAVAIAEWGYEPPPQPPNEQVRDGLRRRLLCAKCDDEGGHVLGPDGTPADPAVRCEHPGVA